MEETPTLWNLAGGYLNEDWYYEYGSAESAILAWRRDFPDDVPRLVAEIEGLLDGQTEAQLAAHLDTQGCAYLPSPEEGGYRGWLRSLVDQLGE